MSREIIGHATCGDCKAKVEVRVNINGGAYYVCDGAADRRLCRATFKWSKPTSRRMIEAAKQPEEAPAVEAPKVETPAVAVVEQAKQGAQSGRISAVERQRNDWSW